MSGVILALTHERDDCAALVLKELAVMNANVVRFNTETFNSAIRLSFEEIGVVWNRRVHEPNISDELNHEPDLKDWMLQEAKWSLSVAMTMFTCPIMNPWEINERMKFNKLIQMRTAAEVGFEIPKTLITNKPLTARTPIGWLGVILNLKVIA